MKYKISIIIAALAILVPFSAQAADIQIKKACSRGLFIRYTDCVSGKAVSRSSLQDGYALMPVENNAIHIATVGGRGAYGVDAILSDGTTATVASFNADADKITVNDYYAKLGWVASGRYVYPPSVGMQNADNLKYPIAELGNCKSKADCKIYCDKPENSLACVNYGEKAKLITPDEAQKARDFQDVIKGDGPGGCKDQTSCKSYCNNISKITECLAFAKKHQLADPALLAEGQKVSDALSKGAKLPGSCIDKASCDSYCKDTSHADECLAFAEKAGMMTPAELAMAKKVAPLLAKGETPGGCKDQKSCESYCADNSKINECADFAAKAGLISTEDAALAKKVGGKGPGGCKSKAECDTYCNKSENQTDCLNFAADNGLIPADQLAQIKDGMGRLRAGIDQAPEEAISCLKQNFGNDVIGKIQSGTFMPGSQGGSIIDNCFKAAMPQLKAKLDQALSMATPQVIQCLKDGLGSQGFADMQAGNALDPKLGDVARTCFESMKAEGMAKLRSGLSQMPAEMKVCVKDALGADKFAQVEAGTATDIGPEVQTIITKCASSTMAASVKAKLSEATGQMPAPIKACVEQNLGSIESLTQNITTSEAANAIGQKIQSAMQGIVQNCVKENMPAIPADMQGTIPGGMPNNIPSGFKIPEGVRQIPENTQIPRAVPTGGTSGGPVINYVPPTTQNTAYPVPAPIPPTSATQMPSIDCGQFAGIPSCDMAGQGRDACIKCKQ